MSPTGPSPAPPRTKRACAGAPPVFFALPVRWGSNLTRRRRFRGLGVVVRLIHWSAIALWRSCLDGRAFQNCISCSEREVYTFYPAYLHCYLPSPRMLCGRAPDDLGIWPTKRREDRLQRLSPYQKTRLFHHQRADQRNSSRPASRTRALTGSVRDEDAPPSGRPSRYRPPDQ